MLTLYHHAFCPFSRAARVALAEYGLSPKLVEERTWEKRKEFLLVNPAGSLPVLIDGQAGQPVCGARAVTEFIEETVGVGQEGRRLMPQDPYVRGEVRRLLDWFDTRFHADVSALLLQERIYKRFMRAEHGGGPPDSSAIRNGRANLRYHLHYISKLAERRNWLAGDALTHADIAAASHLSCIDYLGDVPWDDYEWARDWYARIKSRPSFRPILSDSVPGMMPSRSYADLDF